MSNVAVVVERAKTQTYSPEIKQKSKSESTVPAENRKLKVFGQRVFAEMMNTMKTLILLGAVLGAYKVTGLHGWWTHMVGSLFHP